VTIRNAALRAQQGERCLNDGERSEHIGLEVRPNVLDRNFFTTVDDKITLSANQYYYT
jgi:hypothetical protein